MQRRRKLYKTKDRKTFNLHSIPKLLLLNNTISKQRSKAIENNSSINEDKEVKSNVLCSIPSQHQAPSFDGSSSSDESSSPVIHLFSGRVHRARRHGSLALLLSRNFRKPEKRVLPGLRHVISMLLLICFISIVFIVNNANTNKCYATVSASLSLSNNAMVSDAVTPGNIATTSTNVTVSVSDAESYTLSLKVDSTTITNGSTGTNNTLTAGNVTTDNTWGYKWDGASSYAAPTTSGKSLTVPALSNGAASFTKVLTFGAKFGANANTGSYHGSGTLSLVVTPRVLTTYTLSYNNNGGGTVPSTQTADSYSASHTFTISSTKPTRSGYEFAGYATASTGAVAYQPGGTITIQASDPSQTLYAKWNQIITRTLTYNLNGGNISVSTTNPTQTCSSTATSCTITMSYTNPTRTGYEFLGWADSSTASSANTTSYGSGKTVAMNNITTKTIYAVWKATATARTFTLTLNANGGSGGTASKTCTTAAGGSSCTISLSDVTAPTRSGYVFQGWASTTSNMLSAGPAVTYTTSSTITMTKNTTIYAVWRTAGQVTYTLTYEANNTSATAPSSQSCTVSGSEASCQVTVGALSPTSIVNKNTCKIFTGWNYTIPLGNVISAPISSGSRIDLYNNVTLYGNWYDYGADNCPL